MLLFASHLSSSSLLYENPYVCLHSRSYTHIFLILLPIHLLHRARTSPHHFIETFWNFEVFQCEERLLPEILELFIHTLYPALFKTSEELLVTLFQSYNQIVSHIFLLSIVSTSSTVVKRFMWNTISLLFPISSYSSNHNSLQYIYLCLSVFLLSTYPCL